VDGMLEHLHEAIEFKNISNGEVNIRINGIAAFRQQAEQAKQFFQTREQRITNLTFGDTTTTIDIDYQAVLAIDLPNGMKKGDTLALQGKSIFQFQDDKIISITDIA
jgi:3-deoxy-D-arabino-heptulosonate 7-phosphate (DAHP) synthase